MGCGRAFGGVAGIVQGFVLWRWRGRPVLERNLRKVAMTLSMFGKFRPNGSAISHRMRLQRRTEAEVAPRVCTGA